jgi:hypothetical protein
LAKRRQLSSYFGVTDPKTFAPPQYQQSPFDAPHTQIRSLCHRIARFIQARPKILQIVKKAWYGMPAFIDFDSVRQFPGTPACGLMLNGVLAPTSCQRRFVSRVRLEQNELYPGR